MKFNKYQKNIWLSMLRLIDDYRNNKLLYYNCICYLEFIIDNGNFQDELYTKLYNLWLPLEIEYAVYVSNEPDAKTITFELAEKNLLKIEKIFKSKIYWNLDEEDEEY